MRTAGKTSVDDTDAFQSLQTSGKMQFHTVERKISGSLTNRVLRVVAGYRRWTEFDAADQPGQDFCGYRCDDTHAVMVVADGVSQSFFGDLAARCLGNELLTFLWKRRRSPPDVDALRQHLNASCELVTQLVRTKPISPNMSDIMRLALEATRRDGSQTVFGAAVVDCRSESGWLYLLGDIVATIEDLQGARSFTGPKKSRWSNTYGVKGEIHVERLVSAFTLLLKSDGVATDWGDHHAAVTSRATFESCANQWATADDVSFVWLCTRDRSSKSGPSVVPQPLEHEVSGIGTRNSVAAASATAPATMQYAHQSLASATSRVASSSLDKQSWRLEVRSFLLGIVVAAAIAVAADEARRFWRPHPLLLGFSSQVAPTADPPPGLCLAERSCCGQACSCKTLEDECTLDPPKP